MLGVLFFFSIGGHLKLVHGLVVSFMIIAPGQLALLHGYTSIIQHCSLMFTLAIMLASPVIIALLLIEISAAMLTRNMPQISTYFLTLPIKIMLGFVIFGLMFNYLAPIIDDVFSLCYE